MKTKQALGVVLALTLTLAGCSSGSGGGGAPTSNPAPTLVAVTFLGAGAAPVAGDKLRFVVSEAVTLTAALLDATDLVITGGTLGAVSASPSMISIHEVEITLGAGVALSAGVTTFSFGAGNDAVADMSGQLAVAGTVRTLTKGDNDLPSISALTLSGVHGSLNGTGAAGGTLQVATTGFDVDLAYSDPTSAVDPTLNIITATVAVLVSGTSLVAGENLVPHLTAGTASPTVGSYTVPAGVVFPQGNVTISCYVIDTTGRVSTVSSFGFLVRAMNSALQPFEKNVNASQIWFLDTSRDIESMTVNLANSTTPVELTAGANSRSDLEDVFEVLGLWTASPAQNVSGTKNSNEVVMDLFQARVLTELSGFFAGVNVTMTFTSPGAFPGNVQFVDYNSFGFSQICIAGAATTAGNVGIAGRAIFDPHNEVHENDCLTNFNGERLGVFLHTIVNDAYKAGASTQFAITFNPFMPTRIGGGTSNPIGSALEPLDPGRLTGSVNDQRASDIARAINDLARLTAVIVAHECGHSMGLVQDGPMPTGLYGNQPAFGSSVGHIAMPISVFPGNSLNIMTPAIGYVGALDLGTRFNSLNLAYLRESVIYN